MRLNAMPSPQVEFQSSPVPEDGCNLLQLLMVPWWLYVSILTRPGGRVQPLIELRR